jgi:hypothetical protein
MIQHWPGEDGQRAAAPSAQPRWQSFRKNRRSYDISSPLDFIFLLYVECVYNICMVD